MAHRLLLLRAGALALIVAFPGSSQAQDTTPVVDLAALSPVITNPLFPLSSLRALVYEGEERDAETGETIQLRVEVTILPETTTIAGIETIVAEVKEYEDEELVEQTEDFYVQGPDGTVYYMGERVAVFENGTLVGHEGAWLAGEGENQPGIFMPAHPEPGKTFEQERAPGVAEDRSTVIAVEQSLTTPAGQFDGCLHVEDFAPLDNTTGFKYYCPGVGIAREEFADGYLDLVSIAGEDLATPVAG
jgi:hypothetical protein